MWEGPMGGAELTPTPLSRGSGDTLPAPGAAALKCAEASLQTSSLTLEVVQTSSLTLEVVQKTEEFRAEARLCGSSSADFANPSTARKNWVCQGYGKPFRMLCLCCRIIPSSCSR